MTTKRAAKQKSADDRVYTLIRTQKLHYRPTATEFKMP